MLAIQQSKNEAERCTPNFLPCKVNYNGAIDAKERYWKPERGEDGKYKAFFRGRELHGKQVKVPDGYEGAVLRITENVVPNEAKNFEEDVEEDEEDAVITETRVVEKLATFDEVVIWGHEVVVDSASDPYAKGIEEWISFATAMHSSDVDATTTS